MKTLNRTLSLVLVLVMVLGLFGVASAAKLGDFEDKGDVTYTEAVDYLTAAGIVAGDTSTTISPKGEVTREQAAKLMAYAMLGQAAADNLKATSAPFTDVAANRWSAGYIAYCVQTGVINGMGDGTFAPEENVTGYQMAKMLLCALGYGVNGEFTGGGWALETAKYALAKDIFYGNVAGASDAPANREEAFLYTFNTLTRAMLVKYNDSLGVYYSGTNPFENNQKHNTAYTIGYQRFKMNWVDNTGTYDEAAHYWAIDGKKVTGTYPNDPIVKLATSSDGTSYTKLTTKGNAEYIGYAANKAAEMAYYVNGDSSTLAAVTSAASIRGNVINFYDTDKDGKYDTVEALTYSVAKLSAAPTISTAGGNSVVTMADIGMDKVVDDNIDGTFATLEKDDYVLFYHNAKKTSWTIEKCETVAGQLYGFNDAASTLNINGSNYKSSQIPGTQTWATITATKGLAGTEFMFDAGKNVVAAEPKEEIVAAANVVFILNAETSLGTVSTKVLMADGTTAIKQISKFVGTDNKAVAPTYTGTPANDNIKIDNFYTFTEDANGALVLKVIADAKGSPAVAHQLTTTAAYTNDTSADKVFVKGVANFFMNNSGASDTNQSPVATLGTAKTVFVLEGEGSKEDTYSAITGVSNIPNVNATSTGIVKTKAFVLNDKDGYAVMAVALKGDLDSTVSSLDYVFVGAPASTVSMTNNASDDYYNYPVAIVNGEIKAFDSEINSLNPFIPGHYSGNGVYAINSYDNQKVAGTVDATKTELEKTRIATEFMSFSGDNWAGNHIAVKYDVVDNTVSYIQLDANQTPAGKVNFVVTDDVKVFFHDVTGTTPTIEIGTLASLKNIPGATLISGLSVSKDDATVNELYITILPEVEAPPAPPATTDMYRVDLSDPTAVVFEYYNWDEAPSESYAVALIAQKLKDAGNTVTVSNTGASQYEFVAKKTTNGIDFTTTYKFTKDATHFYEVFKVTAPTTVAADGTDAPTGAYTVVTTGDQYAKQGADVSFTIKITTAPNTQKDILTITTSKGTAGADVDVAADTTDTTTTVKVTVGTSDIDDITITAKKGS